ncbi:MAG: argininosuccinate lyase, partial [Actinobacteria bacterium]|nr:argininosuccinate lyase [Actinomycetota bacterium]
MTNESLWGGRFSKPPASETAGFSSSLHFDARMWRQDLDSTRAHAAALHRAGLLTNDELQSIQGALDEAASLFQEDRFVFDASDEDIHSAIERFLTDRL